MGAMAAVVPKLAEHVGKVAVVGPDMTVPAVGDDGHRCGRSTPSGVRGRARGQREMSSGPRTGPWWKVWSGSSSGTAG